jgi:hypothetical protein
LKPETIKCYARQLVRAIEIIFASHSPRVLRRKHVSVTECGAADIILRRDGDRMNDSSRCYSCRCYSCRVRNAGIITYEGAAKPAAGQRNLTGAVRSHGRDGTRTRGNEGAIANVGFVIGADAVASSRMFRMARNVSALRPRTRRAACSRTNRRSTVRGFDGVRHRPN